MSRNRTRTIESDSSNRYFAKDLITYKQGSQGPWTYESNYMWGGPITSTNRYVWFDKKSYSTMTDEVSHSGHPYQNCLHTKCNAGRFPSAILIADNVFTGTEYPYTWYFSELASGDLWVYPDESKWSSPLTSQLALADWTSDVITLANLVQGLVQSKTLLGVTLKELPQTIRMITNPFGFLKGDWRKLARNHSASRLAKAGANLWLEYRYGWGAMLYDFKQFARSTEKYLQQTERYRDQKLERYAGKSVTTLQPLSPTTSDSDWNVFRGYVANGALMDVHSAVRIVFGSGQLKTAVSCYCTDVLDRQISQLHKLLFAYGLSYEKILASIWEAVPYSFVVDWFVNTGGLFSAFQFNNALKTLSSAAVSQLGYSAKVVYPFWGQFLSHAKGTGWNYRWSTLRSKPIGNNPVVSEVGHIVKYQRHVGLPPYATQSFWDKQGLSVQQGLSGLSLLFQRKR